MRKAGPSIKLLESSDPKPNPSVNKDATIPDKTDLYRNLIGPAQNPFFFQINAIFPMFTFKNKNELVLLCAFVVLNTYLNLF